MTKRLSSKGLNEIAGTLFLWLGGILAVLIFADRWTDVVLPLPSAWYTSRVFHLPLCVTFCVLGWWSHRRASALPPPAVFDSVIVYSKPECPLCDTALAVLQDYSKWLPDIHVVNISGNSELEQRHAESIPVVEIDGRIRFRGTVSAELLERLIQGRERQQTMNSTAEQGGAVE
ncbi:MAG: glutaredoxin family protein [Planctomycetaceae bacterium]